MAEVTLPVNGVRVVKPTEVRRRKKEASRCQSNRVLTDDNIEIVGNISQPPHRSYTTPSKIPLVLCRPGYHKEHEPDRNVSSAYSTIGCNFSHLLSHSSVKIVTVTLLCTPFALLWGRGYIFKKMTIWHGSFWLQYIFWWVMLRTVIL